MSLCSCTLMLFLTMLLDIIAAFVFDIMGLVMFIKIPICYKSLSTFT